jgi:hypothetical protein
MKQPSSFSTGDPSYLVVASTSGNVSPTALTISNPSVGSCFFGLRFIEGQYQPSCDAVQASLVPLHSETAMYVTTRTMSEMIP